MKDNIFAIFISILVLGLVAGGGYLLAGNRISHKDQEPGKLDNIEIPTEEDLNGKENSPASSAKPSMSITGEEKILTVYFGNAETVAEEIQKKVGGDLFEIETVRSYPTNNTELKNVIKKEKEEKARPELKNTKDVKDYDIIFIGCPIWEETCPMAVFTYLESQKFEGKTIIPFTIYSGNEVKTLEEDIKKSSNAQNYLKGLGILESNLEKSEEAVAIWLQELGFSIEE